MAVRVAVEIVNSDNPAGDYEVDGETVSMRQLHAGDGAETNLLFTYTPIETIIDGELKFIRPFRNGLTRKRTVRAQKALLLLAQAVESGRRMRPVTL